MPEPIRSVPLPDLGPGAVDDGPLRVAVLIEAMSEEQVALLAEDLVGILMARPRRQRPEVASEPP